MDLRTFFGSLQLPVACLGLLLVAFSVAAITTQPPSPPNSDGFVEGLALLVYSILAFVGFVVAALGFAIPPGEGFGIQFNRWQRRLFVGAALGAVLSLVVPFTLLPLTVATESVASGALLAWLALSAVAILAFVGSLGWRAIEAIVPRLRSA